MYLSESYEVLSGEVYKKKNKHQPICCRKLAQFLGSAAAAKKKKKKKLVLSSSCKELRSLACLPVTRISLYLTSLLPERYEFESPMFADMQ